MKEHEISNAELIKETVLFGLSGRVRLLNEKIRRITLVFKEYLTLLNRESKKTIAIEIDKFTGEPLSPYADRNFIRSSASKVPDETLPHPTPDPTM